MIAMPCKDHGKPGNRLGYGVVRHLARTELLHRVVYGEAHALAIGDIRGKVVRHVCDNPRCIEPTHLLIGTQADNVRDMMQKGRHRYVAFTPQPGQSNVNAKLDDTKVRAIRKAARSGAAQKTLAARFGVSQSLISMVVARKFWRHVA